VRLQISHETTFSFETPAHYAVQILRLTPRASSQQFVNDWRIDVSEDCRLTPVEDPFGNWTHTFSIDGPLEKLVITASGEIMTEETNGIIRGTPERLPISVFLRQTTATSADPAVRERALAIKAESKDETLTVLHSLMAWTAETIADDTEPSEIAPPPAAILAAGKGTARDRSHLFIAAARELEIPARYVTGYVFDPEKPHLTSQVHAWVEAYVAGHLGWVGFDPTLDLCPTDSHVRVATSLDYLDAAPIRATSQGGFGEVITSKVTVREALPHRRTHTNVE
jgi:transglutaminase-like putative cysteine protease